MKNSYDIIEEAVREYYKHNFQQDVIVYFYQKYEHESKWRWHGELVEVASDFEDPEEVELTFLNDFCEGETCVKDIQIIPLSEVIEKYYDDMY